MPSQSERKARVAALSVLSNTILIVFKIIVGLIIGSVSVISEAIHSSTDLIASIIALFAVKTSHKPADTDHPFGHGKIENISGAVEALLIFVAAGWIIYQAVQKLINPQPLEMVNWGVAVMLFSALMNWLVSRRLFAIGRETDSPALLADAWHLRTDVWTSVGVMLGLGIISLGQWFFPSVSLRWVDPLTAIFVAVLIIRAAYDLTVHSGKDLLDARLAPEEEAWLNELIHSHSQPVCGFHRLRTRKSGGIRFIEFHMLVDPIMTVEASHQLTVLITHKIETRFPGSSITIHIEPCNGFCSEVCLTGCFLGEPERAKVQARHQARS